jgi:hypothetical protein
VGVGDEPVLVEAVGSGVWSELSVSDDAAVLVLVDVEASGDVVVDVESDAPGVSVGVLSVGVGLGESSAASAESLVDRVVPVLRVVAPALEPAAPLLEDVSTVEVVGTDPQSELESAIDACARELTRSMATPNNASPIAAPSAAGLRSSALTVHPRFKEPVSSGRARHSCSPHYLWIARLPYSSYVRNQSFMIT